MNTLRMLHYFNFVMATIFVVFYFYQIGYLLLGLWKRHTNETDVSHALHRYAAVISARNEANVIGGLIASLKAQDYPSELLDIYVIADNCTDNTAQVALEAGAKVYRRFNRQLIGKGYALDYLFKCLSASGKDVYDGYFVFDADNYVDPNMFLSMESAALNPVESMGGLMTKAALNTLIGMGTVFVMLIMISLIISLFNFIPKIQAAFSKKDKEEEAKNAGIDKAVTQIVAQEEPEADDTELVAVIAAAIAASEGAVSTDGFVVRSIRKVR